MSSHLSQQKTVQDVKTFEIVQTTPSKVTNVIIMVLFVQSQQTHVLDLSQQKTVQDVQTWQYTMKANHLKMHANCTTSRMKLLCMLSLELLEVKSTDPWLVLVKCVVKHQKWKPRRKRRAKLDVLRDACSTTEDLLTLLLDLEERRAQMLAHKLISK